MPRGEGPVVQCAQKYENYEKIKNTPSIFGGELL